MNRELISCFHLIFELLHRKNENNKQSMTPISGYHINIRTRNFMLGERFTARTRNPRKHLNADRELCSRSMLQDLLN